jgi:hypothetical protein
MASTEKNNRPLSLPAASSTKPQQLEESTGINCGQCGSMISLCHLLILSHTAAVQRSVESLIVNLVVPILNNLDSGTDMLAATIPYQVVATHPCSQVIVEEYSTEE